MRRFIVVLLLLPFYSALNGQSINLGLTSAEYRSAFDPEAGIMFIMKDDSVLTIDLENFRIVSRYKVRTDLKIANLRYKPCAVKGKMLLTDDKGGMVWRLEEDSLVRIDQSFEHLMQNNSIVFSSKDTLYRFGGYGFWSARNFFTFYDEKLGGWEALSPAGSKIFPPGIIYPRVKIVGNEWFVYSGFVIKPTNLYKHMWNKEIWVFDRAKLKWDFLGRVTKNIPDFESIRYQQISYNDYEIMIWSTEINRLDFKHNRYDVFQAKPEYRIYTDCYFSSAYYNHHFFIINGGTFHDLKLLKIKEEDYFGPKVSSGHIYSSHPGLKILGSVLIMACLVGIFIFLRRSFKRRMQRKTKIACSGNLLTYKGRTVELEDKQAAVLNLFFNSEEVSSDEIIALAGNDLLHNSQNNRIKNTIIDQINLKFNILLDTGEKLITIGQSKIDKRIKVYRLKKEFFQL